jgi:hypothetical protein
MFCFHRFHNVFERLPTAQVQVPDSLLMARPLLCRDLAASGAHGCICVALTELGDATIDWTTEAETVPVTSREDNCARRAREVCESMRKSS